MDWLEPLSHPNNRFNGTLAMIGRNLRMDQLMRQS
jgi:hypothetical protein